MSDTPLTMALDSEGSAGAALWTLWMIPTGLPVGFYMCQAEPETKRKKAEREAARRASAENNDPNTGNDENEET